MPAAFELALPPACSAVPQLAAMLVPSAAGIKPGAFASCCAGFWASKWPPDVTVTFGIFRAVSVVLTASAATWAVAALAKSAAAAAVGAAATDVTIAAGGLECSFCWRRQGLPAADNSSNADSPPDVDAFLGGCSTALRFGSPAACGLDVINTTRCIRGHAGIRCTRTPLPQHQHARLSQLLTSAADKHCLLPPSSALHRALTNCTCHIHISAAPGLSTQCGLQPLQQCSMVRGKCFLHGKELCAHYKP